MAVESRSAAPSTMLRMVPLTRLRGRETAEGGGGGGRPADLSLSSYAATP